MATKAIRGDLRMKTIQQHLREADRKKLVDALAYEQLGDKLMLLEMRDWPVSEIQNRYKERMNDLIDHLISMNVTPSDHMMFYICEAASFDRGFDQRDKAMNLIDVSEIRKDIDASGYGCEFADWQESLGYMVADNKLTQDYLTDLLMQYLEEVSFFGMDPARRTERLNEVRQSLDQSMLDAENDKGVPAEEFMKQMANKYGWPIKEKDQRQDELKGKMIEAEMEYLRYCHRRERQRILNGLVDQKTTHQE